MDARIPRLVTTGSQPAEVELSLAGGSSQISPASDNQEHRWRLVLFAATSTLLIFLLFMTLRPLFVQVISSGDHYVYLARHFVHGDLAVDDLPSGYADYVVWNGHKYIPFGPLPGVLLIPFLPLLDAGLPLISIAQLFTLLNVWLFYKVLGRAGVVGERRNWALLLFFGGTVYFSTILVNNSGNSWGFAQITTTTFTLLAIGETLGKRRPLLIGLFIGLAGMARFTALFAAPFFLWMLWRDKRDTSGTVTVQPAAGLVLSSVVWRYGLLFLGVVGPVSLIAIYNYLRFGSPVESGYALALLYNPVLDQARSYGLFSLVHIPKNLFMLLLQGPLPYPSENAPVLLFPYVKPSPWGMGILFTSPALIYAFRSRLKEPFVQACWLAIICVMLPTITYYGVGWVQFGYRYALDFIPFLLLLAARGFPNPLTSRVRILVLIGMLVNVWGNLLLSYRL